jgi:polar amino acid transport system ATP-binding protein
MSSVTLDGVWKAFDDHVVLRGIDPEVDSHSVASLIGSSGSGKSTLLRCINLLDTVDDGTIRLGGEDITDPKVDPDKVRKRVGMVFQQFNLFPHMTVRDNLTLAPRRVHGIARAAAEEKAATLLARVGLSDKASSYPDRLSGGQQQRAALARSLMADPEVILLDEITSALDPELVGEVLDIIRDLKSGGMTMIMATHEMAFAREVSDQVCFLDQGRIIERGTPDQVFGDPQVDRTRAFLRRVRAGPEPADG